MGANWAVTPAGRPTIVRSIGSAKPLVVTALTVNVVCSPGLMVCVCGPTMRPKSRANRTVVEVVPVAPVLSVTRTVTGYERPVEHSPAHTNCSTWGKGIDAVSAARSPNEPSLSRSQIAEATVAGAVATDVLASNAIASPRLTSYGPDVSATGATWAVTVTLPGAAIDTDAPSSPSTIAPIWCVPAGTSSTRAIRATPSSPVTPVADAVAASARTVRPGSGVPPGSVTVATTETLPPWGTVEGVEVIVISGGNVVPVRTTLVVNVMSSVHVIDRTDTAALPVPGSNQLSDTVASG